MCNYIYAYCFPYILYIFSLMYCIIQTWSLWGIDGILCTRKLVNRIMYISPVPSGTIPFPHVTSFVNNRPPAWWTVNRWYNEVLRVNGRESIVQKICVSLAMWACYSHTIGSKHIATINISVTLINNQRFDLLCCQSPCWYCQPLWLPLKMALIKLSKTSLC